MPVKVGPLKVIVLVVPERLPVVFKVKPAALPEPESVRLLEPPMETLLYVWLPRVQILPEDVPGNESVLVPALKLPPVKLALPLTAMVVELPPFRVPAAKLKSPLTVRLLVPKKMMPV